MVQMLMVHNPCFLMIFDKINEDRLKFFQGSVTILKNMANYEEARIKLTNTQLNKLKSEAKNKTGTTLRITKKNFQDEELPHELLLKARQKTKIRNVFVSNLSTDIKLSRTQLSKIIQSDRFLGYMIGQLCKKYE